jgi:hypothetical protein
MRGKNLIILAAIVVAVGLYIILFERQQPTSDEASQAAEKVLRHFDRDEVEAINITNATGKLRFEKSGDEWRVREPLDFPADSSVISSTLGTLANLNAERRLAADEVDPADYGLMEPMAEIRLRMADGNERVLAVGDELPLGSKRALRVDDGAEVVIANGWFVSDLERGVDDWRSKEVIDFLHSDVASIDIESGPDSIRAVRLDDDHWQLMRPLEDRADKDHLVALMSDLGSMQIEEFLDPLVDPAELGLDLPEYELTIIRTDGGEPLRLDLGDIREGENETEVVCRRNGDLFWATERVRTRLSKAPVLWRSKKAMPFETWDAEELRISAGDASISLVYDGNFWLFADDTEANLTAVQEKLRDLANLEATDYDLMAPLTREMGTVEIVFEAEEEGRERPTLTFSFYAPLQEGGKAMLQVAGRDTVMGVEIEDAEKILGNLEAMRPEPPLEFDADSE